VWIIAPEDRIVEVWSPTGSRVATHTETLETAILPGVRLPLEPLLPVVA
jgi:Uma2 family endonuclease